MKTLVLSSMALAALAGCARGENGTPPREVGCAVARGVERAATAARTLLCTGEVTVGAEALLESED